MRSIASRRTRARAQRARGRLHAQYIHLPSVDTRPPVDTRLESQRTRRFAMGKRGRTTNEGSETQRRAERTIGASDRDHGRWRDDADDDDDDARDRSVPQDRAFVQMRLARPDLTLDQVPRVQSASHVFFAFNHRSLIVGIQ